MSNHILCFSWNTDKIPLCEGYLNNKTKDLITKPRGTFSKKTSCFNPLFFESIEKQIKQYNPAIVVLFTEGDLESGTWFHSDFLPDKMKIIKYKLLSRDKYINKQGDYKVFGENVSSRMSIFIKDNDHQTKNIELSTKFFFNDNKVSCNKAPNSNIKNVEALVLYTQSPLGTIAFIGLQFEELLGYNEKCINEIENKFINNKNVDYVFIMGDFVKNLNIINPSPSIDYYSEENLLRANISRKSSKPKGYDEISEDDEEDNKIIYPTFLSEKSPFVGYHDRIFHRSLGLKQMECLIYDRISGSPIQINIPNVARSNHFGILGIYQIA